MELDISQPEPQILVAGPIVDGALVQDAATTKAALNRLKEALACCGACAVACVLRGRAMLRVSLPVAPGVSHLGLL